MRTRFVLAWLLTTNILLAAPERWEPQIAKFEELDRATPPRPGGVLFIGSSTIVRWDTELFFPGMGVVNRGFGGSELEDAAYYFERVVLPHKPRTIVLYSGGNDIAKGKTPEQVAGDYAAFHSKLRAALPKARLIFVAIGPSIARWEQREKQLATNRLIQQMAVKDPLVTFVDFGAAMLGPGGSPRAELYVEDKLHLSHAGYSILTTFVRPLLAGIKQQLWITNAFGDDVHVYEVGTWKPITHFAIGPQPHGIAAPADGSKVFIAIENFKGTSGELAIVDPKTFTVTDRIPVGPLPNEIECTPDGRWVYVPCNDETWWVVDSVEKKVVKQIKTGGRPHNTLVSADGRRMYLSPMGPPRKVTIVDVAAGHQVIGEIPFGNTTRPPAMTADERLLFQNIDQHLGFQVADIATRKVIQTVSHDYPPTATKPTRCHGLCVRPDQQEIWCCDVERQILHVHEATRGGYKQTHALEMPGLIYWVSFTPDSRYGFVSVRSIGKVAVIDCATKKVVTMLDAGNNPKRTQVIAVGE